MSKSAPLYFREFGSGGQPVVILHGLFGFSDNWQTIAKSLADSGLWVFTPDLRNHGRSPHLPTHSYPELAEDVRQFMAEQGMHRASVVGHSMGGKVAMQLALSEPDWVEKLVVVDMEPGQATDNHKAVFRALFDLDLGKITTRQEADDFLSNRIEDFGTRQFLLKNIHRAADGSGAYEWKMNLPALWKEYPKILAPVAGEPFRGPSLFVRGGKSNYVSDSDLALVKALFPAAQIETIAGAGHWVHADKPTELLAVLRGFLG